MGARSRHRLAIASAMLPLVILVGLQSAWAAFACRMDGTVRPACCCATAERQAADERPVDDAARLSASCCCDVKVSTSPRAPSATEATRTAIAPAVVPMVVPMIDLSPAVHAAVARAFERPRSAHPPPRVVGFLAKSAILR